MLVFYRRIAQKVKLPSSSRKLPFVIVKMGESECTPKFPTLEKLEFVLDKNVLRVKMGRKLNTLIDDD